MKIKYILGIVATLSILFIGCGSSNTTNKSGIITDLSNCGGFSDRLTRSTIENLDNNSTVVYYSYQDSILTIKHFNVAFNCCPSTISASSSIVGNTINIIETEDTSSQSCDCKCLYDLELQIEDILADSYEIVFDEVYGNDETSFTVDLDNNSSGSVTYIRSYYPYNVN